MTDDTQRYTQSIYLWCGYIHDDQCGPGLCPPHVQLRKGRKMKCGCISHDPSDHQGSCGHCGAGVDESCAPGCPVDGMDLAESSTAEEPPR